MVSSTDIKLWLEEGFSDSTVSVSGDGRHFEAKIVSQNFVGKSSIQRHRMVYAVLGDKMHDTIHALSLKTFTPDENN